LRKKPNVAGQLCDRETVATFDYSKLSADFAKLAKPAQRALLNSGICTPVDLAKRTQKEVAAFHGIGPSALPILRQALRKHRLSFQATAD
jgi:hypothetical protein